MANKEEKIGAEISKQQKVKRINMWMISTAVLALLVVIMIVNAGITGRVIGSLSEDQAGDKVTELVNTYFIQDGSATLSSVSEESGLYKVTLSYNNNSVPVYITLNGKFLILPNGIVDIATLKETASDANQPSENIPKSDKPKVELFVMSFCPYGVKAENNMIPIVNLLKDKIDFKIKFIVSVNGEKMEDVNSLHGINEAKEDARQAIIMKDYPDKFYDYLKDINENCYPVSKDTAKLEECWKKAAQKLGMDIQKIESAAYGEEGIKLLKESETDAGKYGASGSPTLIINGVKSSAIYSGTEAAQQAICSAFNAEPDDCSQTVEGSSTPAPSGSCG